MRIGGKALATLVGMAALLTGTSAVPAQAAPLGRVCMFEAEHAVGGMGHASFAIKVRGESDHWIYGSYAAAGAIDGPSGGWIKGGTWAAARGHFTAVRDDGAKYYTRYRCVNTRDGNHKEAQAWYRTVKGRDYNVATNNCLHMAMAVFKGYSSILNKDRRLESATGNTPNQYYTEVLPKAGWEMSHRL